MLKKPEDRMANDTDDDLETRWPREGDRMFVEADWFSDAEVAANPRERFYRLPMGYKRAGDILLDRATDAPVDRRNIIYPALFCYRQAIELFLKRILEEFGDESLQGERKTHELNVLWTRFRQLAASRGAEDSLGFEAAEKLVLEMSAADRRSDAFRFATDARGEAFPFGDRGIDLGALRLAMQALENFFECCHMAY
jgi:hypothetical protein